MANTLKKKSKISTDPSTKLMADKTPEVTVNEVVRDERTSKFIGVLSLMICVFLFVSFTSYIFSWQEDQDKVQQFGAKIFSTTDIKVANMFGVLGAYVGYAFIYNGFGIASYLLCTFFFVFGVNLLFGKKVFRLARNLKYVLVGLLVLSVTFAYVTQSFSGFSFGGSIGNIIYQWFAKWLGNFGTGCILFATFFCYIIWRFNPKFSFAKLKKGISNSMKEDDKEEILDEKQTEKSTSTSEKEKKEDGAKLIIATGNTLKNTTESKSEDDWIVPPSTEPDEQLELVDLDEEPIEEEDIEDDEPFAIPIETNSPKANPVNLAAKNANDLVLDIQPTLPEEDPNEVPSSIIVNPEPTQAEVEALGDYEPTLDLRDYQYPTVEMLEAHGSDKTIHDPQELEDNKNQIITTLKNYDISIQRISATVGPTVTLYEIVPAPGVRISKIKNLEDDIALSLAALGIRIIAPIPGKGTIGIEVPNVNKSIVSMKSLIGSEKFQNNKFSLPIALGKKINNENFIVDLATMPHLLMAGATGQGKSVGVNAILVSLLYKKHPSQLKFVLVDPKKVELSLYRVIEKHFLAKLPGEEEAIITDTKKVIATLNALCIEMDNRYDLLKEAGCRNIKEYNEKFVHRKLNPLKGHQFLPFIVLVIDEFADLIMTAGKEVEMPIARLAQLARAVGIHLIIATQRPSVNIITGTIKANFPARIAFKVSSKIDSRTILDAGGAEQLIGKGDMLVSYNGEITRLQCAFVDTPEVDSVCEYIGDQRGYPDAFLLPEYIDEKELESKDNNDLTDRDSLFEDAAKLIVANQMGSTSLIQRRLKLGYNRAGRLMDQLEMAGVVGPNLGSKAREVLMKTEAELQVLLDNLP
ncbi:FtsK/SpoIIIE family DNA translocase [Rhizosphaericola mali]|uniref:DNA translocase FtsK n=1 Tax=Rhizosphaericola mali TaxID=2545455 RepID=A0A5P2FXF0_9BACT|nr:DNA translocase FtsK [Rhizosphaericola mali]QES88194.1 DNA translocase FtsK [Rhizosphaericola mali]